MTDTKNLEDNLLSLEQKKVLKEIEKLNLTDKELKVLLKQVKQGKPNKNNIYHHDYGGKKFNIGVISDTHIGHKNFNYKLFEKSIEIFNKRKIDAIYHVGDILEGMSNREGHLFELEKIGVTNQINHAIDLLSQYKQPIYAILGNHDLWSKRKSNQGVDVGEILQNRIKNLEILGDMSVDIMLNKYIKMKMTHGGNSAYALSYAGQKQINALEGGTKPNIWLNGHLHKAIYMFYRNIHYIESGTFENQTDYMKMKGAPAMLGFYVLSGKATKNGIQNFNIEYFPGYE